MPDGTRLCIPIYREIIDWKKVPPGPEGRLFRDIWILATIHDGITHISDRGVRETLSRSVQDAAKSTGLPNGLELGDGLFKEEKVMEAAE
jgi:hypothetical protein